MRSGQATFLTTAAGAPTSYSEISAVETNASPGREPSDVPGDFAEFQTPPLAQNTDVIGIPSVDVHVSAPAQAVGNPLGPAGQLVLFFKLYDLSPSGYITLPDKLIAPVRIPDTGGTVHVDLPGIVHRFRAGDRIALVVAGGDQAYRGNNIPGPVTISTSPSAPGVLHLPVAGAASYGPVLYATPPLHTGFPPGARCPRATGRLSGLGLGLTRLGTTRAAVRRAFQRSSSRGRLYMDFFCLTPIGVRVAFTTPKLLRGLSPSQQRRLRGRAVLALTANPYYALDGVRPGARVVTVAQRLGLGAPFHVGLNYWYFGSNGSSRAVLKVRHGMIEEIGIADKSLTRNRVAQRRFIKSFY